MTGFKLTFLSFLFNVTTPLCIATVVKKLLNGLIIKIYFDNNFESANMCL